MIRLYRTFTPLYLNPQNTAKLKAEFSSSGKSVWAHKEIKQSLLELSLNKCAYCECKLAEESKYMEVEHFQDKDTYPSKVVDWDNLLPSCKRCNVSKSTHDVMADPIINPFTENPKDHLEFHLYRLRGTTDRGTTSEEVLDLNNFDKVLKKRFDIGNSIQESLKDIVEKLQLYKDDSTVRRRNRLLGYLTGVLSECIPEASYAAISATVLHGEASYSNIVDELKKLTLWNKELQDLHDLSEEYVLRCAR